MKLEQPALGKFLRTVRHQSGLTMEQVCEHAGIGQSMMYRIEGGGDLMLKTVVRIADAYGLEFVCQKKRTP